MTGDRTRPMREAAIDLAALRRNVATLAEDGGIVVDVAGDGYGHGAVPIATVALSVGADAVRVRDDRERGVLLDAGIDGRVIRVDPVDWGATASVYGVGEGTGRSPVMRVSARVISVKSIDAGEPVSYGYTWRAPVRTTLALVPLGYADGIMRIASNRGRLWVAGALRPVVGRVAMNVLVLDMGDGPVERGDEVVLFGDHDVGNSARDWAEMLSDERSAPISALEVTAGIGATVMRRYYG